MIFKTLDILYLTELIYIICYVKENFIRFYFIQKNKKRSVEFFFKIFTRTFFFLCDYLHTLYLQKTHIFIRTRKIFFIKPVNSQQSLLPLIAIDDLKHSLHARIAPQEIFVQQTGLQQF